MVRGVERGRDATGIVEMSSRGPKTITRAAAPSDKVIPTIPEGFITKDTTFVLGHCRAEPITEGVAVDPNNIHPIEIGRTIGMHNGIVSNDDSLKEEYGVVTKGSTDTEVALGVFDRCMDVRQMQARCLKFVGGYVFMFFQKKNPNQLFIAKNFKPLYYVYYESSKVMFISSESDYLNEIFQTTAYLTPMMMNLKAQRFNTDTFTTIHVKSESVWISPLKNRLKPKRALVVASGGMDSTCAAALLKYRDGYEVDLIHFHYGHKAQAPETKAIDKIAGIMGCKVFKVDLDWLGEMGGSTLTDATMKIPDGRVPMETVSNWVWARNLILTSIAAGYADAYNYSLVANGFNLEEGAPYPDNTMEFANRLSDAVELGVRPDHSVEVVSPVGRMMKKEIVEQLYKYKPELLAVTWSCDHANEKPCGRCGCCLSRKSAFKMAGLKDSQEYLDPDFKIDGGKKEF